MDLLFAALADPTRRELLDALHQRDGQTLTALERRFAMSRIAVAKHLRVLERAGLVDTRREGRRKLHHLNPRPIRDAHDNWLHKYIERRPASISELRRRLDTRIDRVFELYIHTTPERLWDAITDADVRRRFAFGNVVVSEWTDGSIYRVIDPRGDRPVIEGVNLRVDPPRRLVQTYHPMWNGEVARHGTSRVTWEISPVADTCRLTVIHDELSVDADPQIYGNWPMILSGLKTWLETGHELTTPRSLIDDEYSSDHR